MTEPKALLPADEMLKALRKRAVTLRSEIDFTKREIATYEGYKVAGAISWAEERIGSMSEAKANREAELAALEQAIAVLEVLNHPAFYQLEDYGEHIEEMGGRTYVGLQTLHKSDKRHFYGVNVMEVLLKAHEALYPSTPAPAETEAKQR